MGTRLAVVAHIGVERVAARRKRSLLVPVLPQLQWVLAVGVVQM